MSTEHEYAFDVKLWAVCRVTATSVKEAREKMLSQLDCVDVCYQSDDVRLTGASIEDDGDTSELIEIDGDGEAPWAPGGECAA